MDPPSLECGNASSSSITIEFWSLQDETRIGGIVTAVIEILFILLGLPWNVMVLVAIIKERLYHQPTIILLMNLVIADLIILIADLPFSITTGIAGEYVIGNSDSTRCYVCRFQILLSSIVYNSIIFTISMMSFDRFIFIYKPLHYEKLITVPRTLIVLAATWTISLIVPAIVHSFLMRTFLSTSTLACTLYAFETPTIYIIYFVVFLLPLAVIIICNVWVIKIVLKNIRAIYRVRKSLTNEQERDTHKQSLSKQMKIKRNEKQLHLMRVFGGLLCSNIITWMPLVIVLVLFLGISPDNIPLSFLIIANLLFLSQTAIHPILEIALISDVREGMKKMFGCTRKKNRESANAATPATPSCGKICDHLEVYNAAIFPL